MSEQNKLPLSANELKQKFKKGQIPSEKDFSDLIDAAVYLPQLLPVGSVIAYAGAHTPEGWLFCDGSLIPPGEKYDRLRALRPSNLPGHVPDLRSRFIVGTANGEGLIKSYQLHDKGGEEKVLLKEEHMPSHSHEYEGGPYHVHWRTFEGDDDDAQYDRPLKVDSNDDDPHVYSGTKSAGSDEPHNNIPPYYALRYIIKY